MEEYRVEDEEYNGAATTDLFYLHQQPQKNKQ